MNTAEFGMESSTSKSAETDDLAAHLRACERARGTGFELHCLAERVHQWLAGRVVTTMLVASVLLSVSAVLS